VLVDANVLLYATDADSRFHEPARAWMEHALNGSRRVAIPWISLAAFLQIATNPRASREPLQPAQAWAVVEDWLAAEPVWVPAPGSGHASILGRLVTDLELRGNLISDAVLAALCIEFGLDIVSADSDFARFTEISWINPVAV
jgi:hypothetical protein